MQTAKSEEAKRVTAESLRASAEIERASSETVRKSSEAERVKAESDRASAEQARSTAESLRTSAEQNRTNAEGLRVEAEASREATEQLRAEAETERARFYEGFNGEINSLKSDLINVKADVSTKASQTDLDRTNLYLDALFKLNKGQTWDTIEAERNAYAVDVPSGAKYASVDMVGGKSVVFEQRLKPEHIAASKTENGITFTNNGDGTITVSGTATDNTSFIIGTNNTTGTLKNKPFILTGCPKGGSVDTYFIGIANTNDMFKWDKGDGYYGGDAYNYGFELSIHILSGTVIDTPITFKPNLFIINTSDFPSLDTFKKMFPLDYYPYCKPTIISSQNDRVDIASADGMITKQITTNFPALNSAGSAYDYIDLNEGKLHRRVGVVDLGTIKWTQGGTNNKTSWVPVSWRTNVKPVSHITIKANILCNKYDVDSAFNVERQANDKTVAVNAGSWIYIYDSAYVSATPQEFKEAMQGVMLYYELAEPIVTDIEIPAELADWLTVEAGGSITFHNADDGKRLLIPNKQTFVRKLDEVM